MRSKRKISLTVDEATFELFRSYCYGNGMKVSSKVEQMMKQSMKEEAILAKGK